MDQGRLEGLSESCEYDMCSVKDDILETICFHAEAVVEECQLTTGIVIADWRTPDFCGELVFTWKQGSGKAREGWRGGGDGCALTHRPQYRSVNRVVSLLPFTGERSTSTAHGIKGNRHG